MKNLGETRTAGVFKSVIKLRQWSDFDRLALFLKYILDAIHGLFSSSPAPSKAAAKDSFDSAVQQYHLTEAKLLKKQKNFYRIAVSMCCLGLLGLAYTVHMAMHGTWRAVMLSTVVDLLAWVLAFRYHFWYFQTKEGKLGMTFREWYRVGFMGRKNG